MKCPSSVFVHHSIKFCQSHWLWSCAKLVCSGWSKYSSKTISIFSFFLAWKHSWCDFPPLIWQAQKWQGAPSSLSLHGPSSWICCVCREKMGSVGQSHVKTLLGPNHQDQTGRVGSVCWVLPHLSSPCTLLSQNCLCSSCGIASSHCSVLARLREYASLGKAFPNISCNKEPTGSPGCHQHPSKALFVLLSHLYLFNRPDKANICDALFILWLSLEHIKLIITSYKPEIGIFLLASVDSN